VNLLLADMLREQRMRVQVGPAGASAPAGAGSAS